MDENLEKNQLYTFAINNTERYRVNRVGACLSLCSKNGIWRA